MYTILSKPNCPQCQQAELMAKAKGVEYEKKMLDVDYDMEYLKEVLKGAPQFKTFPIILKNGNKQQGEKMKYDISQDIDETVDDLQSMFECIGFKNINVEEVY